MVPRYSGSGCFNQFGDNEKNWLVPPSSIVSRVVNKIKTDKPQGILVVPLWRLSPYWPLIQIKGEFVKLVRDTFTLSRYCTVMGVVKNCIIVDSSKRVTMIT